MLSLEDTPAVNTTPGVFQQITKMGHEQVLFCYDEPTGLKAIIAVHDTTLGPSLGGTRFWNYATDEEAITDVLRLSRGMTYKSSISGINLGGGKAVIIGDRNKLGNEGFWRRYGQFVNSLGGKYYTAEDVGTSPQDMAFVQKETNYVAGIEGVGGDPSPVTAYGVYLGLKASAKKAWGTDNLTGRKILVEGVGHVGTYLVEHLTKDGAEVLITDIDNSRLKAVNEKFSATVVSPAAALDQDIEIYAPCALGSTLNSANIERLKAIIIAGAANNQLADELVHGEMIKDRGLLYAPDFMINAGGVINCYCELDENGYDRKLAMDLTEKIYDRTLDIYNKAEEENITSHKAALRIAEERIAAAKA